MHNVPPVIHLFTFFLLFHLLSVPPPLPLCSAALARWFSLGLLQLQRITWEHSPGQLLQRVQQTEAVHKMQHLEELQRRLQQSDRRVFAFMHPSLPGEPLVVLHTAIMDHVPCSMQAVLAQQQQPSQQQQSQSQQQFSEVPADKAGTTSSSSSSRRGYDGSSGRGSGSGSSSGGGSSSGVGSSSNSTSAGASVACFYSISSGQKGLAGVDLGNFLIKKAAQLLLAEMPQLTTLVTLSPIPGFRAWLITKLRQSVQAAPAPAAAGGESQLVNQTDGNPVDEPREPGNLLKPSEAAALLNLQQQTCNDSNGSTHMDGAAYSSSRGQQAAAAHTLLALVQDNSWLSLQLQQQEVLQPVLLRLCAAYLLQERRRNFALDPVAHFHLRNGAQLWRINWRWVGCCW
jgi:malonyl-CoA decarboxylase